MRTFACLTVATRSSTVDAASVLRASAAASAASLPGLAAAVVLGCCCSVRGTLSVG